MSDPYYRDPRNDPAPLREEDIRARRLNDIGFSNAIWGWIAGGVAIALVLLFIFSRGTDTAGVASNESAVPQPPAQTSTAPPRNPATTQAPQRQPSTTGQGTRQ
jgi:hypothetical protein